MLAADTVEYSLGWSSDEDRATKTTAYHDAFRNLTARWHARGGGPPAAALHAFLEQDQREALVRPGEWSGSDLVAFRCNGEFLHATESARTFWAIEANARKGSDRTGVCLVCGEMGPLLQTIPLPLPARLAPGASNQAALVSVNKRTHGFDLQDQLVHTPICVTCGLFIMAGLRGLLEDQHKSTTLGPDARLAWWVTGNTRFDITVLTHPEPGEVAELLASAARGRPADVRDPSYFCALVVGGNIARVMVRDWIELPLHQVRKNLARWFADHEIVDRRTGEKTYLGVGSLAFASGRWIRGRGDQPDSYARFGASGEHRPHGIQPDLFAAAILGRPLPPKLLAHVVQRIRSDGRVDTPRAALVRLGLRRHPAVLNSEAFMPTLNPDHHQPAYIAGRVFAELEDLQISAARGRGEDAPNTTFADRYFARAVTSPAVALVAGRKDARAWLKRLRRDKPSWAAAAERRLDDLFSQLDAAGGIPHGALLADQAAFILGYHQQRAARFTQGRRRADDDQVSHQVPADTDPASTTHQPAHAEGVPE